MFSLNPGSLCDVCAEEYGPHNRPHSIPCGHVLCLHCCNNILEKTSPRLTPSCPFCRVPFTSDTIRLIRVDFGSSGWSTPRRGTVESPTPAGDVDNDDDVLLLNPGTMGSMKARAEARRLEHKVAKVAAKKCSLEEVTTLRKELEDWLQSDVKRDDQVSMTVHVGLDRTNPAYCHSRHPFNSVLRCFVRSLSIIWHTSKRPIWPGQSRPISRRSWRKFKQSRNSWKLSYAE